MNTAEYLRPEAAGERSFETAAVQVYLDNMTITDTHESSVLRKDSWVSLRYLNDSIRIIAGSRLSSEATPADSRPTMARTQTGVPTLSPYPLTHTRARHERPNRNAEFERFRDD